MDPHTIIQKIRDVGIIPVVRAGSSDEACRAVDAICEGGVPIVEITMTVPNAVVAIREVVRCHGSAVLTGAGTVLNAAQAAACLDAGAQFLVSPGLSVTVLQAARLRNRLAIPGVLTPSELMSASEEGVNLVKVFPCGSVGGAKYIKSLRGPFPQMDLIPTGGVNLSNAEEYIDAGAFALGIGSDLVDVSAIRAGNTKKIIHDTRALVEAVRAARAKK